MAGIKFAEHLKFLSDFNIIVKERYEKSLNEWINTNVFSPSQMQIIRNSNNYGHREAEILNDNLFSIKWNYCEKPIYEKIASHYYTYKTDDFENTHEYKFPIKEIYDAVIRELQTLNISYDAKCYSKEEYNYRSTSKCYTGLCYSIKIKWIQ